MEPRPCPWNPACHPFFLFLWPAPDSPSKKLARCAVRFEGTGLPRPSDGLLCFAKCGGCDAGAQLPSSHLQVHCDTDAAQTLGPSPRLRWTRVLGRTDRQPANLGEGCTGLPRPLGSRDATGLAAQMFALDANPTANWWHCKPDTSRSIHDAAEDSCGTCSWSSNQTRAVEVGRRPGRVSACVIGSCGWHMSIWALQSSPSLHWALVEFCLKVVVAWQQGLVPGLSVMDLAWSLEWGLQPNPILGPSWEHFVHGDMITEWKIEKTQHACKLNHEP
jgi:hypothetical protein